MVFYNHLLKILPKRSQELIVNTIVRLLNKVMRNKQKILQVLFQIVRLNNFSFRIFGN